MRGLNILTISLFGIGSFFLYGMFYVPQNNNALTKGTVCVVFFFVLGILNIYISRQPKPTMTQSQSGKLEDKK